MPALLVAETAASPLAPGVLQAAGPLGRRPRGRTYLEKLTSFTILVFFKCSSEKFRSFRYVPLATALPHLGPTGTSKLHRGVRKGQSPGLPAAHWMPLDCRGTAENRSNSLSPGGRPVASLDKMPSSTPHAKPQRDREFGVYCPHAGRDGHARPCFFVSLQ